MTTRIYIKPLMLLLIMVIGVFTAFVVKHTGKRPNGRLEKAKEVNGNDRTLFLCLNELAGLTSTVIIMALAAYFAIKGSFSVGIVIAFGQLSGKIISPIMTASDTWIRFKSSGKLTEKYKALLQDSEDTGSKREKQAVYGDIELKDVSLTLGEKKAVNHFLTVFEKGKKYLVVGESGSGKSTLLHIISAREIGGAL